MHGQPPRTANVPGAGKTKRSKALHSTAGADNRRICNTHPTVEARRDAPILPFRDQWHTDQPRALGVASANNGRLTVADRDMQLVAEATECAKTGPRRLFDRSP